MHCSQCTADNPESNRFCGQCGAELDSTKTTAVAERRPLTVVFCDVVNSTQLSESLEAEDWREVVRAYQQELSIHVDAEGGHIAQYLGDGVLIYFGFPRAAENDPVRAIRCAAAIVSAAPELNAQLQAEYNIDFAIRIGIHTGSVVVGTVGSGRTQAELAFGDVVNIAARIEGLAPSNGIAVSDATRGLIGPYTRWINRGAHELKGIANPMRIWLADTSVAFNESVTSSAYGSPLLGRESETAALEAAWEKALDGRGAGINVIGEPGIGKSHLIETFEMRAMQHGAVLKTHCSPYHQKRGLHPIISALRDHLGAEDDDQLLNALQLELRSLSLPEEDLVPVVAPLLGIRLPRELRRDELPEAQHERALKGINDWLIAMSKQRPLLVVIEDLHWADESTTAWLLNLGDLIQNTPLMILASSREVPDALPWAETLHLSGLDATAISTLIRSIRALDEETVGKLISRSDGIPLFAVELTRSVRAPDEGPEHIPMTLQAALTSRLDILGDIKGVAQSAAAIGRRFSRTLLEALIPAADLERALDALRSEHLVTQYGADDYTFTHSLIRDAAYDSMLKPQKKQIHGRIAEQLRADKTSELIVLAHHCELADNTGWAIEAWQRAAGRAQRIGANYDAERYLHAVENLSEQVDDERERLNLQLTTTLQLVGVTGRTQGLQYLQSTHLQKAMALSEQIPDFRAGFVRLGYAMYYVYSGEHTLAVKMGREAVEIGREYGIAVIEVMGDIAIATSSIELGHFRQVVEACARAREKYNPEEFGLVGNFTPRPDVMSYFFETLALWNLGTISKAKQSIAHALELASNPPPHPSSLGLASQLAAWMYLQCGELETARGHIDNALPIVTKFGDKHLVMLLNLIKGCVDVNDNPSKATVAEFAAMLANLPEAGAAPHASFIRLNLALGWLKVGERNEAMEVLQGSISRCEKGEEAYWHAELHRHVGQIEQDAGNIARAKTHYQSAVEIARTQEARVLEMRALDNLLQVTPDADQPQLKQRLQAVVQDIDSDWPERQDIERRWLR